MFGIMQKNSGNVTDISTYLEVHGVNKVAYRITTGTLTDSGYPMVTYGIEATDLRTGVKGEISNFSRSVEEAVDFAEMLIQNKVKPLEISGLALKYLCASI